MEQKLREYRALRRRKEILENTKEKLENTKQKVVQFLKPKFLSNMNGKKKDDEVLLMEDEEHTETHRPIQYEEPLTNQQTTEYEEPIEDALEASEVEATEQKNPESWQYFIIKWSIYSIIWLTLWIFFLMQEFGAVFFAVSVLICICVNTSTRRKKPGEISAYSVFNRNCESIDGTLKAEDLQRQMLYGVAGIRTI